MPYPPPLSRAQVYTLLRSIPAGKVVTYGQLATLAGHPKAARAIGLYMRTNPDAPHTPCHRVVAADGSLHGYSGAGGLDQKRRLLLQEGVAFQKNDPNKVDLNRSAYRRSVTSSDRIKQIPHQNNANDGDAKESN